MSKLKTVVYLIDTLGAGGAERQLIYLLSGLDRTRFSPIVLTLYNNTDVAYHYQADLDDLNIPIYSLNLKRTESTWKRFARAVFRYIRWMWKMRPQVVQGCLHTSNLIARIGKLFCPPHRLITWAQSLYTPNQLQSERRTAFLSDVTVVPGANIANHLISNGHVPARKIKIIAYGIDTERFITNPQPDLRHKSFPEATFIASMVARIDPRKNHILLLESLQQLREEIPSGFRLLLIGAVTDATTQKQIETFIEENDLSHWIIFIPATQAIAAYYHLSDITLLTSYSEAFPNVLLESFAAGKPVIASSVANAVGVVEPTVTGWEFPSGDMEALAICLKTAWNMTPEDLNTMGNRARVEVEKYSIPAMAQQYMALYDK